MVKSFSTAIFGLAFFTLGHALTEQIANFDISAAEGFSYDCGQACVDTYQKTQAIDMANFRHEVDLDFYATAANFSQSNPGDLLKLEVVNATTLNIEAGITVYRMQYTSTDLDGSNVPVTGFVAFPYAEKSPSRGFRLIAWAHGTSGLYPGCVPSNGPTLYDNTVWQPLVQQGYAVVGSDYAGIGNNYTTHKYLSFSAHATDVYYSTLAARQAFGCILSKEWISIGHSQGGGTVWKLSESDFVQDFASGYIGTVGLAPASYMVDMAIKNFNSYPQPGVSAVMTESLKRAVASYNESCLTQTMRNRMALEDKAKVCFFGSTGMTMDLDHAQVMSPAGLANDLPVFEAWQNATAPALGRKASSPMLIIQGGNDSVVLPEVTLRAFERSCRSGNEIHFKLYPGMEHSSVITSSVLDWLPWIKERFERKTWGTKGYTSCSKIVRRPFDSAHMKAPPQFTF